MPNAGLSNREENAKNNQIARGVPYRGGDDDLYLPWEVICFSIFVKTFLKQKCPKESSGNTVKTLAPALFLQAGTKPRKPTMGIYFSRD